MQPVSSGRSSAVAISGGASNFPVGGLRKSITAVRLSCANWWISSTVPNFKSGATDTCAGEAPTLAGLAAASVRALGPRAGTRVARCGSPPEEVAPITVGPCHAHVGGFDLHAGIVVRAGERERLERLCRYTLRPPIAQKGLRRHDPLRFEPVALLERLAAQIPWPRINLVLYCSILAPRARWRAAVVASAGSERPDVPAVRVPNRLRGNDSAGRPHRRGYLWAELMRRTFGVDVLDAPRGSYQEMTSRDVHLS